MLDLTPQLKDTTVCIVDGVGHWIHIDEREALLFPTKVLCPIYIRLRIWVHGETRALQFAFVLF